MMYIIFSETQKNELLNIFQGIVYSSNKTRFDFVRIKNNKWILPETVKTDIDILNFLTPEKREVVNSIISNTETREINEDDKFFTDIFNRNKSN